MRAIVALALLALAACTGGHRYGVPRTLAPGQSAHHVSLDAAVQYDGQICTVPAGGGDGGCSDTHRTALVPAYALRHGVVDRVELGVGFAADTALSLDAKVQLVRSRFFDVAIAPTAGFVYSLPERYGRRADPGFVAHMPLLFGINLGRVTLVPGGSLGVVAKGQQPATLWAGSMSAFVDTGAFLVGPGVTMVGEPDGGPDPELRGGFTLVLGGRP